MEVEQIRKERKKTAEFIGNVIGMFEANTGMTVSKIVLYRAEADFKDNDKKSVLCHVDVKVVL